MRENILTVRSRTSSLQDYRAPLVIAGLIVMLAVFGDASRPWLSFDRQDIESGQIWRLITGHFVHLGAYHCLLNLLGLIALLVLCPEPLSSREWFRRVLLLGLAVSAGLYFLTPELGNYVGFSGLIHGLFVLGLGPLVRRKDLIALGCLLYLGCKIVWELYAAAPLSDELAIGGRVVTQSHLFGTLAGLGYGLIFHSFRNTQGESEL